MRVALCSELVTGIFPEQFRGLEIAYSAALLAIPRDHFSSTPNRPAGESNRVRVWRPNVIEMSRSIVVSQRSPWPVVPHSKHVLNTCMGSCRPVRRRPGGRGEHGKLDAQATSTSSVATCYDVDLDRSRVSRPAGKLLCSVIE